MGGIAAIIDRDRPVASHELDPMIALIPHRSTHGVGRASFNHAVLAEAHSSATTGAAPAVATLGPLSIIGDLRLWARDGLRARAGGSAAARDMDDRSLLLAAYQRTGIGFLDDVDGDFAFVIWNEAERRVIAVRDRFGAKPLFFEETATGIRFASEPKQLAATSARPVEPCARSVVEYLDDQYAETRYSFFEGVMRVRPSTALMADPGGRREIRYWSPSPESAPPPTSEEVAAGFRDRLVEAVRRRVATSTTTVSHLTGGLDSSSITAAAHILNDDGRLPAPFQTVSAVFPGLPGDESNWITAIAARQPFPHHDFEPRVDGIDAFDTDMWDADQPRVHRIRGMWTGTASIAADAGADLVLTGSGGDQILDQDQLIVDRLRSGSVPRRLADARILVATSPRRFTRVANDQLRAAVPASVKAALRSAMRRRRSSDDPLVRADLLAWLALEDVETGPFEFGFPSASQNGVIAFSQHASIAWFNEIQDAEYASRGLDVSHPYLDRSVVEYVASIPVEARPLDGRTKTLVRNGFAGLLPDAVLSRRMKTIADEYLDQLFVRHGAEYRRRYPRVPDAALPFLDPVRYGALLTASTADPPGYVVRESIWNAWTLMAWLDVLRRF